MEAAPGVDARAAVAVSSSSTAEGDARDAGDASAGGISARDEGVAGSLVPQAWCATAGAGLVASDTFAFNFEVERAPFPRTTVALSVLLALALVALVWAYLQHRRIVRSREELREANHQLAAAHLQLASEAEGDFTLSLSDDGEGFDARNRKALKGRGLAGIRARLTH